MILDNIANMHSNNCYDSLLTICREVLNYWTFNRIFCSSHKPGYSQDHHQQTHHSSTCCTSNDDRRSVCGWLICTLAKCDNNLVVVHIQSDTELLVQNTCIKTGRLTYSYEHLFQLPVTNCCLKHKWVGSFDSFNWYIECEINILTHCRIQCLTFVATDIGR